MFFPAVPVVLFTQTMRNCYNQAAPLTRRHHTRSLVLRGCSKRLPALAATMSRRHRLALYYVSAAPRLRGWGRVGSIGWRHAHSSGASFHPRCRSPSGRRSACGGDTSSNSRFARSVAQRTSFHQHAFRSLSPAFGSCSLRCSHHLEANLQVPEHRNLRACRPHAEAGHLLSPAQGLRQKLRYSHRFLLVQRQRRQLLHY